MAFILARLAGLRSGAWVTGWLVATAGLHVQLSTHERPWVPLTFFTVAAGIAATRYVADSERMKWLGWSSVLAGLALATHHAGAPVLALPGLAWLFGPVGLGMSGIKKRLARGFGAVAIFAVVALIFGHLYAVVHGFQGATVLGENARVEAGAER